MMSSVVGVNFRWVIELKYVSASIWSRLKTPTTSFGIGDVR